MGVKFLAPMVILDIELLRNCQAVFHRGCPILTFPPALHKSSKRVSIFTTCFLSVFLVLNNSHPNGCVRASLVA